MNIEKMKGIFSDEAFVKSLVELETAAEVQAALKEKGIELSEEEIHGIRELLGKFERCELTQEQLESWGKQAENGELSEQELEQVAGGIDPMLVYCIVISVVVLASSVFGLSVGVKGRRW